MFCARRRGSGTMTLPPGYSHAPGDTCCAWLWYGLLLKDSRLKARWSCFATPPR